MEKKINLEEIARQTFPNPQLLDDGKIFDSIIVCMKEACRQVLELAAENADVRISRYKPIDIGDRYYADDVGFFVYADKQSILNTINQVE